jgi:hypothetical protein
MVPNLIIIQISHGIRVAKRVDVLAESNPTIDTGSRDR